MVEVNITYTSRTKMLSATYHFLIIYKISKMRIGNVVVVLAIVMEGWFMQTRARILSPPTGVEVSYEVGCQPTLQEMSVLKHKVSSHPFLVLSLFLLGVHFLTNWGNILWHSSWLGWKAGPPGKDYYQQEK
jgi:hypothetical protein